jgi:inner membrane transporter RhtA
VGPLGFVWIRVGLAALILLAVNAHALRLSEAPPLRWAIAAGAAVALMNGCFYQAIDRIPWAWRRPSSSSGRSRSP